LIIVPDAALAYLPFEVLLAGNGKGPHSANKAANLPEFLLERFAISYAPSASALAGIKARRQELVPPEKRLIAFGDPVYHKRSTGAPRRLVSVTSRSVVLSLYRERGLALTELPYTRAEVTAIGALFPDSQREIYLGRQASEHNVKTEKLDQYNYIHFAAHGHMDEERPARSGIVLSLNDDTREDGVLQMREIMRFRFECPVGYALRLSNRVGQAAEWRGNDWIDACVFLRGGEKRAGQPVECKRSRDR
jgi:CHAT domain-containing protein